MPHVMRRDRLELFESLARAASNRGQRLVIDGDLKACPAANQLVEAAEQRTAADQRQAALGDIGRELGRCSLEEVPQCIEDLGEWLLQGSPNMLGVDGGPSEQARRGVASGDVTARTAVGVVTMALEVPNGVTARVPENVAT